MSLSQLILQTCSVIPVFECPLLPQKRVHVCLSVCIVTVCSSCDVQEEVMLCLSVLAASNLCMDANFTVSVAKPARKKEHTDNLPLTYIVQNGGCCTAALPHREIKWYRM